VTMAFLPIAETIPNYRDFKNNFLKAFVPGTTTTPKVMATDDTGATTVDKFELDKDGFPKTSGGALVIPYIDGRYDLWLFPTAAEADANDTVNAKRFAIDISGSDDLFSITTKPIESITLTDSQTTVTFTTINVTKAEIFLTSLSGDGRRLLKDTDYTETSTTVIELTNSYPAGTICFADETAIETAAFSDDGLVKDFATLAVAIADTKIKLDDSLNLAERILNNGGGHMWDVITKGSTAGVDLPNTFNIVASTGVTTLALKLRIDSIVFSKAFGVTADGTANDTTSLTALRDFINTNTDKELHLDEGTYRYSTSPNWAIQNLVVKALGKVTFRNIGTGDCLIFDDATGTTFNINFCWDNPLFVEGADATGDGVFWQSCHHSKLGVNIRGCGEQVFHGKFAVTNEFNIVSSVNQGSFFSATAPKGILLTERSAGEEFSANTFYNPIIEGMIGVGIQLDKALNNNFYGGTSEGNAGANVECLSSTRNNTFTKIDLEVSGSSEGFIDRGRFNNWIEVFNDANSTITSTAKKSRVVGGIHNAIINAGESTMLDAVNYGANTGEVTDTGTLTTITDAYDLESASIKIRNKAQGRTTFTDTITVGAFAAPSAVPGIITKTGIVLADVKIGDNINLITKTAAATGFDPGPTAVSTVDGQINITFVQLSGAAVSPLPAGADFVVTVNGK